MPSARWLVFPLPACGDYLPLLAIQDGRLGAMVAECLDQFAQATAMAEIWFDLYPNQSWSG